MRQTRKVSWLTADTNESIALSGTQHKNAGRFVYLLQPGKQPIGWEVYKGDAMVEKTNIYVWIAEMNFPDQTRNISDNRKIALGKKALCNNTPLLFPVKLSYFPETKYEDVEASTLCPYDGHKYPKEVLEVDGRTCGNCIYSKVEEFQANPRFGIELTCKLNEGNWKQDGYCSKYTPPSRILATERTLEENIAFEKHHSPEPWEFEE